SPLVALLATGLVAALFQPLRARLQRGVDRLLYGVRPDPYREISRLGGQLEETQADLQRSRERLVTTREEERRRLRRDLHDRRRWRWPPTASCRRRWLTWCATPTPVAATSGWGWWRPRRPRPRCCGWRSPTMGSAYRPLHLGAGWAWGWPRCASGQRNWAGR